MGWQNVLELGGILIVFILVLAATYYASKWIGKTGAIQMQSSNIKVIETFRIAQNKYIQIIQLGSKYYSIAVTKDNITFLAPLDEEQLDLTAKEKEAAILPFGDVLNRMHKKQKKEK